METMEMFGAVLVSTVQFNSLHTSLRKLGHCYLMMDDLQQAYSAYQQALYHLRDPKVSCFNQPYLRFAIADKQIQEPKLWYGIGILYDRYGSLEHAEEAFSQVMRMQPDFEKANEIYFRLGIIYKQQQKYQQSLEVCNLKRQ
jgi:glucose repression mediator protein